MVQWRQVWGRVAANHPPNSPRSVRWRSPSPQATPSAATGWSASSTAGPGGGPPAAARRDTRRPQPPNSRVLFGAIQTAARFGPHIRRWAARLGIRDPAAVTVLGYAEWLGLGQSIGSGLVEGACRQVIGRRMKQTGARWRARRANRMATPGTPTGSNVSTNNQNPRTHPYVAKFAFSLYYRGSAGDNVGRLRRWFHQVGRGELDCNRCAWQVTRDPLSRFPPGRRGGLLPVSSPREPSPSSGPGPGVCR